MTTTDHWIATPAGRLFARAWSPSATPATTPAATRADTRAAVVLLHDSLGCVELWRDFPARLAAALGRRVVAYDRLGFGRSDPHPGRLEPGFVGAEAEAGLGPLRAALGLGRIIPFGHSVGGGMAVGAAARLPEACAAVVTLAAQAFVEDRTLEGIRAARAAFADPAQFARLERYHGAKARWVLDAWTETWLSPVFAAWSLDADLARLRCPVLALHGDRDEYGSARHPERIAARAGGAARHLLLPGCGHVPHREMPDAVLDEATRFLGAAVAD